MSCFTSYFGSCIVLCKESLRHLSQPLHWISVIMLTSAPNVGNRMTCRWKCCECHTHQKKSELCKGSNDVFTKKTQKTLHLRVVRSWSGATWTASAALRPPFSLPNLASLSSAATCTEGSTRASGRTAECADSPPSTFVGLHTGPQAAPVPRLLWPHTSMGSFIQLVIVLVFFSCCNKWPQT